MIEDNPTNLKLMVFLLKKFGHEVLQAHDGAEGVEKARQERPELILLDIHMPRMDGYEAVRLIASSSECNRIPVVAVTALAMVGDREKILASGFSGYISKPVEPETFAAEVQGYLGGTVPPAGAFRSSPSRPEALATKVAPRKKLAVVLFVDNMQTNINLVRSILAPSGYDVVTALSAKEGLDAARRTKPDLIVSDVHMPHQDGYDFMRMVRAEPELAATPFVFLSSSVWSIREQEHALREGAAKFISRPIEPSSLLSQLEECLHKRKKN